MFKLITLPSLGEHTGCNAAYVFLADAVVSHLRPQGGHAEHVNVPQVGQAHQAILRVVFRSSTAEVHQSYLPYTAALVCSQLEFDLCADFRQSEDLQ